MTGSGITVFIDRDGTMNVNLPFPNVNSPEKLEIIPGAAKGLRILNDLGCLAIVVTNQAGIDNPENELDWGTFEKVSERFRQLVMDEAGAWVDDVFCCPHEKTALCGCRKPETGLYMMAKEKYPSIDFARSFIVGDREDDIIAGKRLGIKTVLVMTGHGEDTLEKLTDTEFMPDYIVSDFYAAAIKIREVQNDKM